MHLLAFKFLFVFRPAWPRRLARTNPISQNKSMCLGCRIQARLERLLVRIGRNVSRNERITCTAGKVDLTYWFAVLLLSISDFLVGRAIQTDLHLDNFFMQAILFVSCESCLALDRVLQLRTIYVGCRSLALLLGGQDLCEAGCLMPLGGVSLKW